MSPQALNTGTNLDFTTPFFKQKIDLCVFFSSILHSLQSQCSVALLVRVCFAYANKLSFIAGYAPLCRCALDPVIRPNGTDREEAFEKSIEWSERIKGRADT